jgi:secreted PhoX family phosphatase
MTGERAVRDRDVSRRAFLGGVAATGLGVAMTGSLGACFGGGGAGGGGAARSAGYGPLVPDPRGLLSLPEGFRYRVLAEEGVTRLESGHPSPSDPDGAAAFQHPSGQGAVLICNHEIDGDTQHGVPHLDRLVYDPAAHGGTTTFEVDAEGRVVRQYASLAGTHNNCAGGRTSWGTWLSCEETEAVLQKPHGYVFEVDPHDRAANLDPHPIKALGRFAHEAVAVDPDEQLLYLTEDAAGPDGLLYRYTPPPDALPLGKGSLRRLADDAGVLEALRATTEDGRHVEHLSVATEIGTTYRTAWVPVRDRDAASAPVRTQFPDGEVTRGHKLEGMWWGQGGAYVVSSFARPELGSPGHHDGQVWFLDPRAGTLTLHLRFAADDVDNDPDGPDNITVSPYGGVIIAEDGGGRQHLLGATPGGEVFTVARCELGEGPEFCGPVFSPDERVMFANLQRPGYVFAVEGPFRTVG